MYSTNLKILTLTLLLIPLSSMILNALDEVPEARIKNRLRGRNALRQPDVTTAHIVDAVPATTIERAVGMADIANQVGLTNILGRPPVAADYAIDGRLREILGRPPILADFKYDARLRKLLGVLTPTAHDYEEIPRLTRVLGHFPTIEDLEADARVSALLNPGTDVITRYPTRAEINKAVRMIEDLGGEPTAGEFAVCWPSKSINSHKRPSKFHKKK